MANLSINKLFEFISGRTDEADGSGNRTTLHLDGDHHGCDDMALLQSFPQLMDALRRAKATSPIETVHIGYKFVRHLSQDQSGTLLTHLALLPNLKHVNMAHYRDTRIDATHVATFFQTARCIETCILWPFVAISESSLSLLLEALRQHPSLQSIGLLNLTTIAAQRQEQRQRPRARHFNPQWGGLSPLLNSLASVPNLRCVELATAVSLSPAIGLLSQEDFASDALRCLVDGCHKLESLSLRNLGLNNPSVFELAEALEARTKATSRIDDDTNVIPLTHLDLRYNPRITEDGYERLVHTMVTGSNDRLLSLDLDWNNQGKSLQLKTTAELFLRLNRVGRHRFMQETATQEDRLHVLEECLQQPIPTQLELIFWLLQHKPSFVRGER